MRRARATSPKHLDAFDWDTYLTETGTVAAPVNAFHQDLNPPVNNFLAGYYLRVFDQESLCFVLGRVLHSFSLWVHVSLLEAGVNPPRHKWFLCDDAFLQPLLEDNDEKEDGSICGVRPPYDFTKKPDDFSIWVRGLVEKNKDKITPEETFANTEGIFRPKTNLFEIGMKLEAVDVKNFDGCLYKATVKHVEGDNLVISFDGFDTSYDSHISYSNRNIFPAKYARNNGLTLITFKEKKKPSTPSKISKPQTPRNSPASTSVSPVKRTKSPSSASTTPVKLTRLRSFGGSRGSTISPKEEKQQISPSRSGYNLRFAGVMKRYGEDEDDAGVSRPPLFDLSREAQVERLRIQQQMVSNQNERMLKEVNKDAIEQEKLYVKIIRNRYARGIPVPENLLYPVDVSGIVVEART